jgi:hypothetical protein
MWKAYLAALLNFFLPGAGYLLAKARRLLALPFLLGAVGLTYVELGIKEPLPQMYWIMFGSVFVMNIAFAVDAWRTTAREVRAASPAAAT